MKPLSLAASTEPRPLGVRDAAASPRRGGIRGWGQSRPRGRSRPPASRIGVGSQTGSSQRPPPRKMWCQSWVAMTQVRLRSMMIRLGVIAGNRTCAARSRATPSGSNQPVARSDSGLRSWSTQRGRSGAKKACDRLARNIVLGRLAIRGRQRPRGHLAQQPLVRPPAELVLRRDRRRRRRSRPRRGAGSAPRPTSSSPRGRPWPGAAVRPA